MTTAVIGATGHVGSEIVRGLLARSDAVAALVRDPDEARRVFGDPDGLHIRATRLDDPRDLTQAFDGIRVAFIAMGSIGIEGVLQRIAINVAAGISSIEQVTRLSVLNAFGGLNWNQPASPLQHRPVRFLDRSAVLDDPPRDFLVVAARRRPRGARLAHMDRPCREWPHGLDRPSRRGRGRAAGAHRSGITGRPPRTVTEFLHEHRAEFV